MTTLVSHATPFPRGHFEGLVQILRFNSPLYVAALAVVTVALSAALLAPLPKTLEWVLAGGALAAAGWAVSSLAVSWYVYDRAPTFQFRWAARAMEHVRTWANVHAGFDQTTPMLREIFAATTGTPIDLYDPALMTEPSIHRARAACPPIPGTLRGAFDRLPLKDASVDAVFMLFAAHELRTPAQRVTLLSEAARVLTPGGQLILAEHARGPATFLTFGPGAFHFHSKTQWQQAGRGAGLECVDAGPLTRFAFFYIWRKKP